MLYHFRDAVGIWRVGKLDRTTNYGVGPTYWMRDQHGNIHMLTENLFKVAQPINEGK